MIKVLALAVTSLILSSVPLSSSLAQSTSQDMPRMGMMGGGCPMMGMMGRGMMNRGQMGRGMMRGEV